jgi:hypothetical protein
MTKAEAKAAKLVLASVRAAIRKLKRESKRTNVVPITSARRRRSVPRVARSARATRPRENPRFELTKSSDTL